LESFINTPGNSNCFRLFILGFNKKKKGTSADGTTIDAAALNSGLVDIKKADMEPLAVQDLSEVGKKLFSQNYTKKLLWF
jgi:isopenicillin N synthase-like dioxygenase